MKCKVQAIATSLMLLAANAALAQNHEADWLYFPMYNRDTAHAVHLAALKFRPDGLLSSATRYPRTSEENWTPEENQRGWYGYDIRLIDCETGYFVETAKALLDQNSQTIATLPTTQAQWFERLKNQLTRDQKWPESGGEIYLACAGASDRALKARRLQQRRIVQPLFSYKPITQDLTVDSQILFKRLEFNYEFKGLQKTPSPQALFDALLAQHTAWRKSINPAQSQSVSESEFPEATWPALQKNTNERLKDQTGLPDTVRVLGAGRLEMKQSLELAHQIEPPPKLQLGWGRRAAIETVLSDCISGLQVPVTVSWLNRQSQVIHKHQVLPQEALSALTQTFAYKPGAHWNFMKNPETSSSFKEICKLVFYPKKETLDPINSEHQLLPFGLNESDLAQAPTPEAMLLKIRNAWRAYQP
jgi:hypothetical protein